MTSFLVFAFPANSLFALSHFVFNKPRTAAFFASTDSLLASIAVTAPSTSLRTSSSDSRAIVSLFISAVRISASTAGSNFLSPSITTRLNTLVCNAESWRLFCVRYLSKIVCACGNNFSKATDCSAFKLSSSTPFFDSIAFPSSKQSTT